MHDLRRLDPAFWMVLVSLMTWSGATRPVVGCFGLFMGIVSLISSFAAWGRMLLSKLPSKFREHVNFVDVFLDVIAWPYRTTKTGTGFLDD